MFFVIFIITAIFVRLQITTRFNKFREILQSVINGNNEIIKVKHNNEFGKTAKLLNNILEKTNTCIKEQNELAAKEKETGALICETILDKCPVKSSIILDTENKVTTATGMFRDFKKGKHVFEINELQPFIGYIKESLNKPGKFFNIQKDDKTIEIISIHNEPATATLFIEK